MQHNRWLHWKIQHGLATRGRVGGLLHPKGLLAGLLYKVYFKKRNPQLKGPQTFTQNVGGSVGAAGKCNGE